MWSSRCYWHKSLISPLAWSEKNTIWMIFSYVGKVLASNYSGLWPPFNDLCPRPPVDCCVTFRWRDRCLLQSQYWLATLLQFVTRRVACHFAVLRLKRTPASNHNVCGGGWNPSWKWIPSSHGNEVLPQDTAHLIKDHVTNEEVRAKIQQAIAPHEDPLFDQ